MKDYSLYSINLDCYLVLVRKVAPLFAVRVAATAALVIAATLVSPRVSGAAPLVHMVGWETAQAGDAGPVDTKALVSSRGVGVFFSPKDGATYRVYRHDRTNGRRFVPYGEPVTFHDGGVLDTQDPYDPASASDSGWMYDATYDYLIYIDPNVTRYEEYYYLVWSSWDRDQVGHPISDPNTYLNGYVVAPAFPQAPAHGEKMFGASFKNDFCCSGVSLTMPQPSSG